MYARPSCHVKVSVGLHWHVMFPFASLVDTAACPNLLFLSIIPPHLRSKIRYGHLLRIQTATRHTIEVVGLFFYISAFGTFVLPFGLVSFITWPRMYYSAQGISKNSSEISCACKYGFCQYIREPRKSLPPTHHHHPS